MVERFRPEPSRLAPSQRVRIEPRRVASFLAALLLCLLFVHGVGLVMTHALGHGNLFGLVPLFNLATETNVPTFFATLLLVLNALLFALVWWTSAEREPGSKVWLFLAFVFGFLALDEFAMIHELLIEPVRTSLDTGGLLYFAWLIPYAAAVVVIGAAVAPAIWRLGNRFRALFGVAALLYLGGAMGVEMLGGRYYEEQEATVDLKYRLFQTVEETLEFSGLIALVYTLLELLRIRTKGLQLHVDFGANR